MFSEVFKGTSVGYQGRILGLQEVFSLGGITEESGGSPKRFWRFQRVSRTFLEDYRGVPGGFEVFQNVSGSRTEFQG